MSGVWWQMRVFLILVALTIWWNIRDMVLRTLRRGDIGRDAALRVLR